ncbi:MAG: class I SAM-dependent methyltransferase [Planctomycetota bacterium]
MIWWLLTGLACWLPQEPTPVKVGLLAEAHALAEQARAPLAKELLAAVASLPEPTARQIYRDPETRAYLRQSDAEALDEAELARLEPVRLTAERFYTTRYGSPLAYLRPMELAGQAGLESFEGKRILDFGYGTIAHLRLMALQGADVVGVDVDTFLTALYLPEDRGKDWAKDVSGSVTLLEGRWPGEAIRKEAGGDFDLFLSKNTLKRGYVHPEREANPNQLIDLGTSDEEFVSAVYESLKPGGLFVIYNLCPPQNPEGEPFIPWADGRCPFERELLEKTGFEVIRFNEVDDAAARTQGRALGWETADRPLDETLFAWVTIARKK